MMIKLPKIFGPIIFLITGAVVLNMTTIFTDLSIGDALTDFESVAVALSFPLLAWLSIKIKTPDVLSPFVHYIYIPILVIWAYFAYQYLVHFSFPPKNISGDIAGLWNWLITNKAKALLFVVLVIVLQFLKRGSANLGGQLGESINTSLKGKFNGKN
ncbi:MAG: hypothetical protein L3J05_02020 [Robiginitomaculum sp.]|nr:hypothetical protein [Robiginitomaculum sp.]